MMPSSSKPDRLQIALTSMRRLLRPLRELWFGIRTNSVPWAICGGIGVAIAVLIMFRWDAYLFRRLGIAAIYPRGELLFRVYAAASVSLGLSGWAAYRAALFNQFERKLDLALITSGLRNRLGKTPRIVTDFPVDENTRKLRLSSANFPKKDFDAARPALETGLRVYIDEIREDRAAGCYDLFYSKVAMPSSVEWAGTDGLGSLRFRIGNTRSKEIKGSLRETPHLLVAGQTGGGKSTFLRQFITTLHENDRHMQFTLIDLKGGLEFQLFDGLPRAKVMPDIETSIAELQNLQKLVTDRMVQLKAHGTKDLDALIAKIKKDKETAKTFSGPIGRNLVVIDEATEMFLAGSHASAGNIQSARRILSQIARQGRAVGVHLVIATQRPDTRALDPQVKANLTGVLCFQMANDASSMVVLGNGRATDLPPVPGRAIWKSGIEMVEVQTPLLPMERAESLLSPHREVPTSQVAKAGNRHCGSGTGRPDHGGLRDAPSESARGVS